MKNAEGYSDPTAYKAIVNVSKAAYKPVVYICSPFRGNIKRNTAKAREYCRYAVSRNCIPFAPHLLFPQFMNDDVREERELAMLFNKVFLGKCDELWVFGNRITEGMDFEIKTAKRKGIKIRYFHKEGKEYET